MNDQNLLPDVLPQKQGGLLGAFLFGFILAMVVFTLPAVFLLMKGKFDKHLTDQYLMSKLLAQTKSTTPLPLRDKRDIDIYIENANNAIKNNDYNKALSYLDRVIEFSPENPTAYAIRAKCYYFLSINEHVLSKHNLYLQTAMADIDKAISLQPTEAEYYLIRRHALADISATLPYQVDRKVVFASVIDNERKYLSLSSPSENQVLVSIFLANDLIDTGQCEEGILMVKDLEKKMLPGYDRYSCLMCAAAAGYACLGNMEEAIQSMDQAIAKSNANPKSRAYLKALYQYQAGKKDEALDTLNASIQADSTFVGNRYLLRSLIYLEKGDREQALQDLSLGENYTWEREDIYAYVKAKLALEEGNTREAIHWLQVAEASLYPYSNILKKQIQDELTQLNASPLEMQPATDYQFTPMPPVTPMP